MTKKIDLNGLEEVIINHGPFDDISTSSTMMTRHEILSLYIKMVAEEDRIDSKLLDKLRRIDET